MRTRAFAPRASFILLPCRPVCYRAPLSEGGCCAGYFCNPAPRINRVCATEWLWCLLPGAFSGGVRVPGSSANGRPSLHLSHRANTFIVPTYHFHRGNTTHSSCQHIHQGLFERPQRLVCATGCLLQVPTPPSGNPFRASFPAPSLPVPPTPVCATERCHVIGGCNSLGLNLGFNISWCGFSIMLGLRATWTPNSSGLVVFAPANWTRFPVDLGSTGTLKRQPS